MLTVLLPENDRSPALRDLLAPGQRYPRPR